MLTHQQTADTARKILSYTFAIFAVAAFVAMIVNMVALSIQPELTRTTWPVLLGLSILSIFTGFSKYSSDRAKINMVTALCLIYPPYVAGWGAGAEVSLDVIVLFGIVLLYTSTARHMIYTVVPSLLISVFTFVVYNYGNGHNDTHTIHEIGSAFIVCSIILLLAYLHSKELRLNANMLEHAMIASEQGTIRRNFDSNTVSFDPVARRILGLNNPVMEWEAFIMFIEPSDREKVVTNCGTMVDWNLELCFNDTCIDVTRFTTSSESIWLIRDITHQKIALIEAEEDTRRFEQVTDAGKMGVWQARQDTREFIQMNDQHRRIMGLPEEEYPQVYADDHFSRFSEKDSNRAKYKRDNRLEIPNTPEISYRKLVLPSGEEKYVRVSIIVEEATAARPYRLVNGAIIDITEEVVARHNAEKTNKLYNLAIRAGSIGTFRHDLATDTMEVNDMFRELRCLPKKDYPVIYLKDSTQYIVTEGYGDLVMDARTSNREMSSFESKLVLPNGDIRYQQLWVAREEDEEGNLVAMVGALIDTTEKEMLLNSMEQYAGQLADDNEILELREKELLHLINHDHLTKILSRRGMGSAMRERFDAVGIGSVIAFDLDFFKPINDTYGHAAGDHVLRTLSQEVTRFLPDDCLFGRMGGEEFMIYTPKDNAYAYDLAHKLRALVENINPTLDDGTVLHITSSFGVCGWIHNRTIDTMVGLADKALYQSKLDGRNRVTLADNCFLEELHSSGGDISIADIEKALERGEFEYFVQPIIRCSCDGATQNVVGFEALMRWTTNPISPEIFIDKLKIALNRNKEARLIMQQKAVDVMIAVKEHFPQTYIAFNVDIERFATNDAFEHFTAVWDQALQCRTDIKYSDIVLEISENAISNRVDQRKAVESMLRIKELGVQIALDDFGKASSNIARLNTYPVDILKIDKSFIDNIDIPNSMAFKSLSAIRRLARDMNISVVAEGIEHQSQAEVCMTLGIRKHQGWLYSKAIPLERLAEFKLREKNSNFIDE